MNTIGYIFVGVGSAYLLFKVIRQLSTRAVPWLTHFGSLQEFLPWTKVNENPTERIARDAARLLAQKVEPGFHSEYELYDALILVGLPQRLYSQFFVPNVQNSLEQQTIQALGPALAARFSQYKETDEVWVDFKFIAEIADKVSVTLVDSDSQPLSPKKGKRARSINFKQRNKATTVHDFDASPQTVLPSSIPTEPLPESIPTAPPNSEMLGKTQPLYKLTLNVDGVPAKSYPLSVGQQYNLGRGSFCEIQIPNEHEMISRRHLILEVTSAATLKVLDTSSGGTSLAANGQNLRHGEELEYSLNGQVGFHLGGGKIHVEVAKVGVPIPRT